MRIAAQLTIPQLTTPLDRTAGRCTNPTLRIERWQRWCAVQGRSALGAILIYKSETRGKQPLLQSITALKARATGALPAYEGGYEA